MYYDVSLIQDNTINCCNIRHATEQNYVNAACNLHWDRKLPLPFSTPKDYISIVLKEIKKIQSRAESAQHDL